MIRTVCTKLFLETGITDQTGRNPVLSSRITFHMRACGVQLALFSYAKRLFVFGYLSTCGDSDYGLCFIIEHTYTIILFFGIERLSAPAGYFYAALDYRVDYAVCRVSTDQHLSEVEQRQDIQRS